MTNTKDELLACPFCGGEAEVCQNGTSMYWVLCRTCHACPDDKATRVEAIAAWNTRAPCSVSDEVVEALGVMTTAFAGYADTPAKAEAIKIADEALSRWADGGFEAARRDDYLVEQMARAMCFADGTHECGCRQTCQSDVNHGGLFAHYARAALRAGQNK